MPASIPSQPPPTTPAQALAALIAAVGHELWSAAMATPAAVHQLLTLIGTQPAPAQASCSTHALTPDASRRAQQARRAAQARWQRSTTQPRSEHPAQLDADHAPDADQHAPSMQTAMGACQGRFEHAPEHDQHDAAHSACARAQIQNTNLRSGAGTQAPPVTPEAVASAAAATMAPADAARLRRWRVQQSLDLLVPAITEWHQRGLWHGYRSRGDTPTPDAIAAEARNIATHVAVTPAAVELAIARVQVRIARGMEQAGRPVTNAVALLITILGARQGGQRFQPQLHERDRWSWWAEQERALVRAGEAYTRTLAAAQRAMPAQPLAAPHVPHVPHAPHVSPATVNPPDSGALTSTGSTSRLQALREMVQAERNARREAALAGGAA